VSAAEQHGLPRQAVGDLPGRQRKQQQRRELDEAGQAEVERLAVDRVHLPADRDGDHLTRERHRTRDEREQRVVAVPEHLGHAPPHRWEPEARRFSPEGAWLR
jgi:hypothetical protein